MLNLTQLLMRAHKTQGLCTFFIYGHFGDGKTSLLLHATYEFFRDLYNLKKVDAWYMALDYLYFNPSEALLFVETYRRKHPGKRVPMLGMDDVGQHLPRARWWREDVMEFRQWMTVARTDVDAVGFTAPTQLSLPGGIIDSCFLRIHVRKHPRERGMSLAKGYQVSISPYFQVNVKGPVFEDTFPTHYPDFVYEEYQKMRENMVAPLRRNLMKMMGLEKTIETLNEMGVNQTTIGRIVDKDNSTISKRLKRMNIEKVEKES
jgi:hypothetical protein